MNSHDISLSFPPKNVKLELEGGPSLSPASAVFPSACLAQSQIWDEDVRMVLRKPRYKKKDLDQRRSNVSRGPYVHLPLVTVLSPESGARDAAEGRTQRRPRSRPPHPALCRECRPLRKS